MRRIAMILAALMVLTGALPVISKDAHSDPRLKGAFRKPVQNGWTFVHLEGTPSEIGFQHGYLLAPEILDAEKVSRPRTDARHGKDWNFFRTAAKDMMWPHIEPEYREELQGIADGLRAKGVDLDVWDVVGPERRRWSGAYYMKEQEKQHHPGAVIPRNPPEHCSAFVATGSYTKDGKIVIAHNNWTSYFEGARWTIIFDIAPAQGNHIIMDGLPGLIHSGDDFGINSAGILVTETTITHFAGYNTEGIPEFVRARKALQYAASIDDFARIMKEGNNGGYANTWLVGDRKNNEIGRLELGLKNVTLERKQDGYFVGSNFPINPKLIREETDFDVKNMGDSANARHVRWDQLMADNKGKIDVAAAERFLADHFDTYDKKTEPDERTLCGHVDLSPRGMRSWQPPYGIAGAVQNKVSDATMAAQMSLAVAAGHSCGISFKAAEHLGKHPEFAWQKSLLRDMDAYPWTTFSAAR